MNNYVPEAMILALGMVLAGSLIDLNVSVNVTDKPIITSAKEHVDIDINDALEHAE